MASEQDKRPTAQDVRAEDSSAPRQCECCCGDGSEREWFIGAEGEDICARCAAELLGAERDSLRQQLREVVEALREAVEALERIADLDEEYGEETAAGAIALDALTDLGVRVADKPSSGPGEATG